MGSRTLIHLHGLIDEYLLMIDPLLLGAGLRLFLAKPTGVITGWSSVGAQRGSAMPIRKDIYETNHLGA